ncbi:hypothetical protein GYMLUDRAFT_204496 [Collybiopsis luxurians FD-317 M1]|uniref:Zn(2)-C6 fungal-type domain-containing protein n=1 Tax=Collybiopsis luxurians FD-317 M1 TaxID=944289 RepID=A0A0D0C3I9_9AGAR|nr:hypothetical protein GYMLUDRAFT_204496 [Collybiopsis luxurians FD-317 M1]
MSRTSGRSPKGTACINCRQRKIRCDGKRPVCSSCSSTLPSACRYSDGGASPDQLLREEIAVLETRLQQLEHPNDPFRGVSLSTAGSSASSPPHTALNISLNMRQALFRSFLPYSSEFGFFLDYSRFSTALTSPSSQQQPFPSILSSCQLLGAYLSPVNELSALQSAFLSQAMYDASRGLARESAHMARSLLHCVQAEIFLSQYFFINGRMLEGQYRISNAVSMVLGAGFHKIRSADMYALQGRAGMHSLPPPIDPVEEGERVNALWQVVIMNSCWSAASGAVSNIAYEVPESRIDTPWPLDAGSYMQNPLPDNIRGRHTIQNFLSNVPDNGQSLLALHAKAAILFERAALLRRQHQTSMSLPEATRFQQTFNSIDRAINNMAALLPSLSNPSYSRSRLRRLLVVHTLCRAASIALHGTFSQQDPTSHAQVLAAAESITRLVRSTNLTEFPFIDPIMGHLWMMAANVFVDEIKNQSSRMPRKMSTRELMDLTEIIMSAMSIFSPRSSFIESQLNYVRRSYMATVRQ